MPREGRSNEAGLGAPGLSERNRTRRTSSAQGPAAFTTTRAWNDSWAPESRSMAITSTAPSSPIERHEEALRASQAGRHAAHGRALGERLAHQGEAAVLQVAEPAMKHVARVAARSRGQVGALEQHAAVAVAGGEEGDREPR